MPNNKPHLMKGEQYCRACGYIGKRKEFQLPFDERGAGSGGACPSCRVLVAFASEWRKNLNQKPITTDDLHRLHLHSSTTGTCPRCGIMLRPRWKHGDYRRAAHYMKECDACLEMEQHFEGLIQENNTL